ncbi:MAG: MoaD/ThiS family protein [Rhodospirillales bacterium]|nr:MoaD/ThiS family protein [Rhodospirillales bacterium]
MKRVKLYARLDRYLPESRAERNEADLEVPKGTTVAEVFRSLNLPPEVCHLVLVNGHFLPPGERETRALKKGDHLAVWPPVAGGVDTKAPPGAAGEKKAPVAAARTKTVITKEMAITHAEFFRLLPGALDALPFKRTGNRVVVEEKGRRLDIGLGPERTRQIAGLKVPATDVTLSFTGYDKTQIAAALRLFERAYQKGGG